jgi:3-deoxy-7-phosphoheptulonate synthase
VQLLDNEFTIFSGPCSLESQQQVETQLSELNTNFVRAGIYKLRTEASSFQGLRNEGIELIKNLKKKYSFQFVSEVVSDSSAEALSKVVDYFQVGTRNMYNYELLKTLNSYNKPVILKRGFSATIKEWISAANYIDDAENRVILCERGVRSFESSYRNMLDLNAVAYLKAHTNFKVIVDPSHGTGRKELILPLAKASLAVGADGIMIEAHPSPKDALSDKEQALNHQELKNIIDEMKILSPFFGKKVVY